MREPRRMNRGPRVGARPPRLRLVVSERLAASLEGFDRLLALAEAGDLHAHKVLTFGQRYGSSTRLDGSARRTVAPDPRVFSRDPAAIRAYWMQFRNPDDADN